jgi:hypothetical protein
VGLSPLLSPLFPWDDPNFGVDEEWTRFYPYTAEVAAGGHLELKVLRNEAVDAVAPSVTYRARKFASRHWVALTTIATFILVLITATAVSVPAEHTRQPGNSSGHGS